MVPLSNLMGKLWDLMGIIQLPVVETNLQLLALGDRAEILVACLEDQVQTLQLPVGQENQDLM